MPRLTSLTTVNKIYVAKDAGAIDYSAYESPDLSPLNDSLDALAVRTNLSGPFGGDVFSAIETGCDSTNPETTGWWGDPADWGAANRWNSTDALTLEAWIKVDRAGNNLTFPDNFDNGDIVGMPIVSLYKPITATPTQTNDAAIILSVGVRDTDTTKWGIHQTFVNPNGASYNNSAAGSITVDSNWHHIALVIYTNDTVNLFIDGNRVNTLDLSGATYRPNSFYYVGCDNVWLFGTDTATGLPGGFDDRVSFGCEGITVGQIRISDSSRYADATTYTVPTNQWTADANTIAIWTPADSNIGV